MSLSSRVLKISFSALRVSLLSFGGGNAAMGIVQKEFVDRYRLIEEKEFLNLLSLTNIFPGPIIVNTVTLLGYRSGGLWGGVMAFLLSVFPTPIIVVCFVIILRHYVPLQTIMEISFAVIPVVTALLLEFVIRSYKKRCAEISNKKLYFFIFFATFVLLLFEVSIAALFFSLLLVLWILGYFLYKRGAL